MRKLNLIITSGIISIAVLTYACNDTASKEDAKEPMLTGTEMIARGEYLVNAIGCDDCHSPKRLGPNGPEVIPELRLSGHPGDRPAQLPDTGALSRGWMLFSADLTSAAGPWGVSFAANITSDGTGIGNWTEGNFISAIRNGKIKGAENGRPILPPMPWYNFAKLTDEDLKSILAYLKTTNPVRNIAPPPLPPAPMR